MHYQISQATYAKLKMLALDIYNLKLVYRNYEYGNRKWWTDDIYTDRQGAKYTPQDIYITRGDKLKQYMLLIESCLVGDPPATKYTPELMVQVEALDRILQNGQ
jgi:hypothetical protein